MGRARLKVFAGLGRLAAQFNIEGYLNKGVEPSEPRCFPGVSATRVLLAAHAGSKSRALFDSLLVRRWRFCVCGRVLPGIAIRNRGRPPDHNLSPLPQVQIPGCSLIFPNWLMNAQSPWR